MLALAGGAKHGYAIKQDVEARTDGEIRLGPGTLYEAIQRLEDGGLIARSRRDDEPGNGQEAQRRYYKLTERGWNALRTEDPPARPRRRSGPRPRAAAQGPGVRLFRLLSLCLSGASSAGATAGARGAFEEMRARSRATPGSRGRLRLLDVHHDRSRSAPAARLRLRAALERAAIPRLPLTPSRNEMDTIIQDVCLRRCGSSRGGPDSPRSASSRSALAIGANSLIYGLVRGLRAAPVSLSGSRSARRRRRRVSPSLERHDATSRCCRRPSTRTSERCAPSGRPRRSISATATSPVATFRSACSRRCCSTICFPVIGMPPQLGRGFTREELAPGGAPVAIISNRLWHSRFGGDPGIVGRSVRIGSQSTHGCRRDAARPAPDRHRPLDAVGRECRRRAAQPPAVHGPGPASPRCLARRRQRRARGARGAAPIRPSRSVQGIRRLVADRRAVGGGAAPGHAAGRVPPARRGRRSCC